MNETKSLPASIGPAHTIRVMLVDDQAIIGEAVRRSGHAGKTFAACALDESCYPEAFHRALVYLRHFDLKQHLLTQRLDSLE